MTKKELALMIDFVETYFDAAMAEFAADRFDVDGRIRVGPDHRRLNELKRRMIENCEDNKEWPPKTDGCAELPG